MANFLTLPVELREQIYAHLFSTFTITHGLPLAATPTTPTRLSLLLTSRQLHFEAWRHLALNARFVFRGSEDMLSFLLSAGQQVVTRVRHVAVVAAWPVPLYASGCKEYYPTYYLGTALSLVPGLNLDVLSVGDAWHGGAKVEVWRDPTTYHEISTLLSSSGWRTLIFSTPTSDFLTSGARTQPPRHPQPEAWSAELRARDAGASFNPPHTDARVEMFITPKSGAGAAGPGPGPGPSNPGRQNDHHGQRDHEIPFAAAPGDIVLLDPSRATPQQSLRGAVRIVARRALGARVAVTGMSLRDTEGKSWREIKGECGGMVRDDWTPYHHDMADGMGWIYGGWARRMQMASEAMGHG